VKITGLYPLVRVDTSQTSAVGQAGGVLLTRTVTGTGLDRHLTGGPTNPGPGDPPLDRRDRLSPS
jgi:hypothetical protein